MSENGWFLDEEMSRGGGSLGGVLLIDCLLCQKEK